MLRLQRGVIRPWGTGGGKNEDGRKETEKSPRVEGARLEEGSVTVSSRAKIFYLYAFLCSCP